MVDASDIRFRVQGEGHEFRGTFASKRQLGVAYEIGLAVAGAIEGGDDAGRQGGLAVILQPDRGERMPRIRLGLIEPAA
jgi:hypothetical protein